MVLAPKIFNAIKQRFANDKDFTPLLFAQTIINILNDYENIFSQPPFADYDLLDYKDLDLAEYPINYSVFNSCYLGFEGFIEIRIIQLISISFKHRRSFAMLLRSHLEGLFYIELTEYICPNCHSDGGGEVILVKYRNYNSFAFLCQSCNHSEFLENEQLVGLATMMPPTTSELIKYGYLTNI